MDANNPLDATVSQMLAPSQKSLADLGGALRGVSTLATVAFDEFSSMARGLHDTGHEVAQKIRELEADTTLPLEHRRDQARQLRENGELMIRKLNQGAQSKVAVIESALSEALLPRPHQAAEQRMLIRDELRTRYGHLRGSELAGELIKNMGKDIRADSEALSSWGASFLTGQGADGHIASIRDIAVQRYSTPQLGMSERQRAAAKAFGIFKASNLAGVATAHHTAGVMRLRADDRLPARRS
jgi:hypothetical protein